MSENYSPGPGVSNGNPLSTVLLSQRDLGLRVPLNFVTNPGVSLSSACFSQRIYEDDAYAECLSNLLAFGFRRFEIDLYWDENRRVWSFCPVEVPDVVISSDALSTQAIETSSNLESPKSRIESTSISTSSTISSSEINPRQLSTEESSTQTTSPIPAGTSLGTIVPTVSSLPETPDVPAVNIGPFVCTPTINLSTFTSQLLDYITKTGNTLGARMLYVFINIHATSSDSSPNQPASRPLSLPGEDELLGNLFSGNLSQYIYSPSQLFAERANLNNSWYSIDSDFQPIDGYFSTATDENQIVSTEDGWPSEVYVEFSKSERLLLGWGTVDPQMEAYNFNGDAATIFENGYIARPQAEVIVNEAGQVTNGCFLNDGTVELSQVNSSWAITSTLANFLYPTSSLSDLNPLLSLANNLTACGISPHLNTTLLNTTATQNPTPYFSFANSTVWSWQSPFEPISNPLKRCASSSSFTGRWSTTACDTSLRAACRLPSSPYNWTLTPHSTTYPSAISACPPPYTFAVPRTALENAYLTQRLRAEDRLKDRASGEGTRVWLDFNAIDSDSCWVSGGSDATCPYLDMEGREEINRRTLLVALIAAIIVLVITALTIFVMCAGNRKVSRRSRKRKKRAEDNMNLYYEGVPS